MALDAMWDDIFSNNDWGRYPAEPLVRFVARNFYKRAREQVRLLEVGCGPGGNVWFMAREGFRTYGIDGSEVAIRQAGQRLKAEGLRADFQTGDISKLPYESGFFDGVVESVCLYFNNFAESKKIVEEIHRVLKPEGLFFSRTFAEDCFKGESFKEVGRNEYTGAEGGPFSKRGFFRLSDESALHELYGSHFDFVTMEKHMIRDLQTGHLISEWVLTLKRKSG